jgi:hypothetical protein
MAELAKPSGGRKAAVMTVEGTTPLISPNPPSSPGSWSAVGRALRNAAHATGASFDYLLATAKAESDLNPNLSMRGSTATGLFQFIEQTWLSVMKQAGQALGLGGYAQSIEQTADGRYVVKDPAVRQEIMNLRQDPAANAVMAGIFTRQNANMLGNSLGRTANDGELYMAHFLGPGAATRLIRTASADPTANAATLFPAAARANRPIFYDPQGNTRSVSGVYAELTRRYQEARASPTLPAGAEVQAPDTAGLTEAFAAARGLPPVDNPGPAFHSLFSSDDRQGGIAPVVSRLWSSPSGPAPTATAASETNASRRGTPLDLFRDSRPNVRGLFGVAD